MTPKRRHFTYWSGDFVIDFKQVSAGCIRAEILGSISKIIN